MSLYLIMLNDIKITILSSLKFKEYVFKCIIITRKEK